MASWYLELSPPASLADIIRCFWFIRGTAASSASQTMVGDGRIELVLQLGEPFRAIDANGLRWTADDAIVAGQLTRPLYLGYCGALDVVGIRFRTAAAATILRANLAQLVNAVAPLAVSDGLLRLRLLEAVRQHTTPFARVEALADVLSQRRRGVPDPVAGAYVRGCPGAETNLIDRTAEHLGITVRTLQRRVRAACGASPVVVRRMTRFRLAYRAIARAVPGTWARVAAEHGYFDQAHFNREFRRFVGAAPGDVFRAGL